MFNRLIYFIGFMASLFFATNYLINSVQINEALKYGIDTEAEIIELPVCNAKSSVYVKLNRKKYNLILGKNQCIEGGYRIGDRIPVIYYSKLDKVVSNGTNGQFGILVAMIFFLLPLFCLYKLIKK